MTTKPMFKAMFKRIEFSNGAATVMVDTKGIDTMTKLAKSTSTGASKLANGICSTGGTGTGTHVTEGAEYNLVIAATVANNTLCVSCSVKCAEILSPNSLQFERHEQQ